MRMRKEKESRLKIVLQAPEARDKRSVESTVRKMATVAIAAAILPVGAETKHESKWLQQCCLNLQEIDA